MIVRSMETEFLLVCLSKPWQPHSWKRGDAWEETRVKTMPTLSSSVILPSVAQDKNWRSSLDAAVKGDYRCLSNADGWWTISHKGKYVQMFPGRNCYSISAAQNNSFHITMLMLKLKIVQLLTHCFCWTSKIKVWRDSGGPSQWMSN